MGDLTNYFVFTLICELLQDFLYASIDAGGEDRERIMMEEKNRSSLRLEF